MLYKSNAPVSEMPDKIWSCRKVSLKKSLKDGFVLQNGFFLLTLKIAFVQSSVWFLSDDKFNISIVVKYTNEMPIFNGYAK